MVSVCGGGKILNSRKKHEFSQIINSLAPRPDPTAPWIKEPTGLWEVLPDSTSPSPRGYGECPARTSTP